MEGGPVPNYVLRCWCEACTLQTLPTVSVEALYSDAFKNGLPRKRIYFVRFGCIAVTSDRVGWMDIASHFEAVQKTYNTLMARAATVFLVGSNITYLDSLRETLLRLSDALHDQVRTGCVLQCAPRKPIDTALVDAFNEYTTEDV